LHINNGKLTIDNVDIYDVMGRLLQSTPEFSSGVNLQSKIELDISHLSAGIYFFKVYTDKDLVVSKIVKE